jgi:hypothetical protein
MKFTVKAANSIRSHREVHVYRLQKTSWRWFRDMNFGENGHKIEK